jgi:predicted nucleic acid-binding Zn ribbon protein
MSFITFDYLCTNCDTVEKDVFIRRSEMDKHECGECGALMKRLPAGPTTTFKFGDRSAQKSRKAVSLRDQGSTDKNF